MPDISDEELKKIYTLWLTLAVCQSEFTAIQSAAGTQQTDLLNTRLGLKPGQLTAMLNIVKSAPHTGTLKDVQSMFPSFLLADAPYIGPLNSCYTVQRVLDVMYPAEAVEVKAVEAPKP